MTLQQKVLDLVNQERIKAGVGVLTNRSDLTPASDLRAKESLEKWSHTRPNGTPYYTVDDRIYGENLSKGFKTATDIVRAWMNSATHRDVMLDPRYKGACVGIYKSDDLFVSLELTK